MGFHNQLHTNHNFLNRTPAAGPLGSPGSPRSRTPGAAEHVDDACVGTTQSVGSKAQKVISQSEL